MKKATIGGIVKQQGGVGFKITFENRQQANKYKDMFAWILRDDKFKLLVKGGYYDANKD